MRTENLLPDNYISGRLGGISLCYTKEKSKIAKIYGITTEDNESQLSF